MATHHLRVKNDTKPSGGKISAKSHADYIFREDGKSHANYINREGAQSNIVDEFITNHLNCLAKDIRTY